MDWKGETRGKLYYFVRESDRILEWVAFPFYQGIFPTQGLNSGLLHCGRILYQLSHKENPTILEWVAYPFSSGSSWPRNWTQVSCIAGGFLTNWAIRQALLPKVGRLEIDFRRRITGLDGLDVNTKKKKNQGIRNYTKISVKTRVKFGAESRGPDMVSLRQGDV